MVRGMEEEVVVVEGSMELGLPRQLEGHMEGLHKVLQRERRRKVRTSLMLLRLSLQPF